MKLFNNNIVPYASAEGDKIYPIVVDIKKGIKSGEAISFVTADNQVGVITVDFMDGNSSYSIEGCMVTSTIHRPDGTVLEIPCDIISQSTIEIPLGINGTYQEGTHTFDLKIVRGNGKVIGVPTMSYSVSGSLSSDDVVEGDDRLPVLTMVLDNAQDKLTRLDKAIAGVTNDLEVKEARDGEVTLNARLERDLVNTNRELEKIKKLEESTVSTITSGKAFTTVAETTQGYFEDVKIEGKTLVNLIDVDRNYKGISSGWTRLAYSKYILPFNKEYTIIFTNKSNNKMHVYANETAFDDYGIDVEIGQTIISKLTTLADNTDILDKKTILKFNPKYGEVSETNFDLILLEGDHTDKDISYFEGLKSVGQGSDEISVESVNPNGNLFDGTLEVGSLNASGDTDWISYVKTGLIRVKPSSEVICKIGKYKGENATSTDIRLAEYDINKNFIKFIGGTYKATVSDKTHYVKVAKKIGTSDDIRVDTNAISDVVVVYGNELHNIPHQSDKKEILYYNPTTQAWEKPVLREWDRVEKHDDGKYYYHKRSGVMVLNGSEGWYSVSTLENVIGFGVGIDIHGVTDLSKIVSDRFNYVGDDKLGQIRLGNSGKSIFIYIDKSRLSTQDVAGFKQWLQANNVTVVYQLAQEEVYECTNLDLITYNRETNLIVNSGAIQPKVTLKVLSNVSNVVKLLQEKVSVLENKFIEGLKQVLAGDMYSLAHLLYPEDFENNHEIQTLEL